MIAEDDVIPYHKEPILELTGADSPLLFFEADGRVGSSCLSEV